MTIAMTTEKIIVNSLFKWHFCASVGDILFLSFCSNNILTHTLDYNIPKYSILLNILYILYYFHNVSNEI